MSDLDFSDVLCDPSLTDKFSVLRRAEVVNDFGESEVTSQVTRNVVGVVCAASSDDLERLDDSQRMGRHISIVTKFRLQGPSTGRQPDLVQWQGDNFVVKALDPYPQFGAGFVQAIAGSIDTQDFPTP